VTAGGDSHGGVNTEHADPGELAVLRGVLGRPGHEPAPGARAVAAFETAHAIRLPEPYRTFATWTAGGLAAGPPRYGLLPPGALPGDWGRSRPPRDPAAPFPLTRPWIWEDDPRPDEEIGPLIDRVTGHGTVVLGSDGCAMYWHLVVTGAHRGQVWHISGEGAIPFGAPFGHTTAEPGFAGWVGHWAAGRQWFDRV
jgi:hypothetical protein